MSGTIGRPSLISLSGGRSVALSAYSSVAAVDAALTQAGVIANGTWPDGLRYDYPKDWHFERYVLSGLTDMASVKEFLDALDRAGKRRTPFSGACSKAHVIRVRMSDPFRGEDIASIRRMIASARRVSCGCHETGSFARYERGRYERHAKALAA